MYVQLQCNTSAPYIHSTRDVQYQQKEPLRLALTRQGKVRMISKTTTVLLHNQTYVQYICLLSSSLPVSNFITGHLFLADTVQYIEPIW